MITISETRIPTLAGLGLLLTGVIASLILVDQPQILKSQASASSDPKQINIVNLSSTSASIIWQTEESSFGFIQYGLLSSNLDAVVNDERDLISPQKHLLHFVTLTNLRPDTTYYYRINSAGKFTEVGLFKTPAPTQPNNYPALIGAVIDENLQPVPEVLILLHIPGAQTLAAISKVAGNFNLPLSGIRTKDLSSAFNLADTNLEAELRIFNNQLSSSITLETSILNSELPALILGQDRKIQSPQIPTPTPNSLGGYDLNLDNKLDDLDREIIRRNFFKPRPDPPSADINQDGVVNQQDLTIFNVYTKTSAPTELTPAPR